MSSPPRPTRPRARVVPPPPPDPQSDGVPVRAPALRGQVGSSPRRRRTAVISPPSVVQMPHTRTFTLTVVHGNQEGASFTFNSGHATLGAHRTNEVQLQDPSVSDFHCQVRLETLGLMVKDLGSLNGTFVDAVRVREAHLDHGCLLGVGRVLLKVEFG